MQNMKIIFSDETGFTAHFNLLRTVEDKILLKAKKKYHLKSLPGILKKQYFCPLNA